MAQYPFDQKFIDVVESLLEAEDDSSSWTGWHTLIHFGAPGGEEFDALVEAGYSSETIFALIKALKELPVADLIELALKDECAYCPASVILDDGDGRDLLERAIKLTSSANALERELGVRILMRRTGLTFKEEAVAAVTALIATEKDDSTSAAIAYAVSHLDIYACSEFLARVAKSPNPDTRNAAAYALGGRLNDDLAVKTLIGLSQDQDDDVRDWATFGLYLGLDKQPFIREDIREALFANIDDAHDLTRYEALQGLAECKDPRVIPPLILALELDAVWNSALEAAIAFGHPDLYPSLVKLNERIPNDELIEKALSACTPKAEEK